MSAQKQVVVSGVFDDIKSRDLRFLEEASKLGELSVLLWPDAALQKLTGKAPKFLAGGTAVFSECRPLRQPRD
jgi:glycerol-3-phosphate cytidylyltransferase-like family protein